MTPNDQSDDQGWKTPPKSMGGYTSRGEPFRGRLPDCAVCEDQGWALADVHEALYGRTIPKAFACLCLHGERRRAANTKDGRGPKTLADIWTADEVAAAFPGGTAQAAAQAAQERLAATGLPLVCRAWTVASYRATIIAKDDSLVRYGHYAETWIAEKSEARGDVVLFGTRGTGKTGLAVAMARGAFDRGASMRFTTARDLMLAFRESMRDDGSGESSIDARFSEPQVLVIDEFGASVTDYQRNTLTALVDARQKAQRATLITLNVEDGLLQTAAETQAAEMIGARLADRLTEHGQWWPLFGASKRRRTRVRPQSGSPGGADGR